MEWSGVGVEGMVSAGVIDPDEHGDRELYDWLTWLARGRSTQEWDTRLTTYITHHSPPCTCTSQSGLYSLDWSEVKKYVARDTSLDTSVL